KPSECHQRQRRAHQQIQEQQRKGAGGGKPQIAAQEKKPATHGQRIGYGGEALLPGAQSSAHQSNTAPPEERPPARRRELRSFVGCAMLLLKLADASGDDNGARAIFGVGAALLQSLLSDRFPGEAREPQVILDCVEVGGAMSAGEATLLDLLWQGRQLASEHAQLAHGLARDIWRLHRTSSGAERRLTADGHVIHRGLGWLEGRQSARSVGAY